MQRTVRGASSATQGLSAIRQGAYVQPMDKDAQTPQPPIPDYQMDPDIVPASLPDPAAVDDGDEEDGRL